MDIEQEFPFGVDESKIATARYSAAKKFEIVDYKGKFKKGEILLARSPKTGLRGWVMLTTCARVGDAKYWSVEFLGSKYETPTGRPVQLFPRMDTFKVIEHPTHGKRIKQVTEKEEVGSGSQLLIGGLHYTLTTWDPSCNAWCFVVTLSHVAKPNTVREAAKKVRKTHKPHIVLKKNVIDDSTRPKVDSGYTLQVPVPVSGSSV